MKSIFWNRRGEFRLLLLYIPAVALTGVFANLRAPVLEIVWDMVFYKGLAFGLHHFSTFDLNRHFPMPPLYPFLISPGFFASDYLTVEMIQSWINPALYFLGLYPLYAYARRFLDPSASLFVCLLYLLYPAAAYTQWSMSENLAAPLALCVMLYAMRLLTDPRPRMRDGALLGFAIAGLVLTRIFLIVFCAAALFWVANRTARRDRDPSPVLMAFSTAFSLVVFSWWQLGYFTNHGPSLVYADFNQNPLPSLLASFFAIFSAHWTGLWLEGGLLITGLVVVQWLIAILFPQQRDPAFKEAVQMILFLYAACTVVVAWYYVKRMGFEPWSISLRYIFYLNLVSLPAVVAALGVLRRASRSTRLFHLGFYTAIVLIFSAGFLIPASWAKFSDPAAFFSNAPSLDFLYQIRNEGAWAVFGFLAGLSCLAGAVSLFSPRAGFLLLAGFLLYLQLSTFDQVDKVRRRAVQDSFAMEIHDLCRQIQMGKWEGLTLYCDDNIPLLVPNLYYWVNRPAGPWPEDGPRPRPPYLLVSRTDYPGGRLEFESGELKVYLFE
ncbi:MAG: glycosyltransferase family 39 protein [Candidatus Omnitrophica bacterium]|nr:glycosyltransferase family 39 protein [Candidatus Omnitrophota bacterium]